MLARFVMAIVLGIVMELVMILVKEDVGMSVETVGEEGNS